MSIRLTPAQMQAMGIDAPPAPAPKARRRNPETDLVRACLDMLAAQGVIAWRNNTTGVYDPSAKRFRTFSGRKGVSDILGILPGGRFLAVECKVPGKKPSKEQQEFLADVNAAGGVGIVAFSVDDVATVV